MTHRIEAAKLAVISIMQSGVHGVIAAAGAIGLNQQLNQTHNFLYLDLPIWIFFVLALFLSFVGSLFSLLTDLMKDPSLTFGQKVINLTLGFAVGVISSFVVLPAITAKPPVQLLMITALIMSFVGAILVKNIGDFVRSPELWLAVQSMAKELLKEVKDILIERFKIFITLFFGGRNK